MPQRYAKNKVIFSFLSVNLCVASVKLCVPVQLQIYFVIEVTVRAPAPA